jgi:hypothetical protein
MCRKQVETALRDKNFLTGRQGSECYNGYGHLVWNGDLKRGVK